MADDTRAKALADDRTIILTQRHIAEREQAVLRTKAGDGKPDACKATIVAHARAGRFRKGDLVFVAVPSDASPHDTSACTIKGPLDVTKHWDPTGEAGAGSVDKPSFFRALAQLAHPLTVKRREENDSFELGLA